MSEAVKYKTNSTLLLIEIYLLSKKSSKMKMLLYGICIPILAYIKCFIIFIIKEMSHRKNIAHLRFYLRVNTFYI